MDHRGGVEEMLMFGCSFGTEAPSVAGAEGPDGSFRVSRWRQMAEGQRTRRGSWTPAGVGTGGGEYLAGSVEGRASGGEVRDGERGRAAALNPSGRPCRRSLDVNRWASVVGGSVAVLP